MTVIQLHPPSPQSEEPAPFQLGVNYWPVCSGPALFKRFDIDEVHGDMNTMAELGLDFVRVFLNWEIFQPDPDGVNCCALAQLAKLCDAAAAEGLKVIVTLFTGYMMGHNWVPPWLLDGASTPFAGRPIISGGQRVTGGYRDPLTDLQARKSALRLARAVAHTVSNHQALWAFDLGNAPDLFSHPCGADVERDWFEELAGTLRDSDSRHEITCALGAHCLCLRDGLHIDDACSSLSFGCIGEQTPEFALATEPLQPNLAAFSCALATELCGKPCLSASWNLSTLPPLAAQALQDTSAPAEHATLTSERAAVDYAQDMLSTLLAVGAVGALVGNYSDFDAGLFETPPFDTHVQERYRGLWRADGTLKPHGQVIRQFAETNPAIQDPPTRRAHVEMSVNAFYDNPLVHCQRLFRNFSTVGTQSLKARSFTPIA
jgi:hypothetical protein